MKIKVDVYEKLQNGCARLMLHRTITDADIQRYIWHDIVEEYGLENARSYEVTVDEVIIN